MTSATVFSAKEAIYSETTSDKSPPDEGKVKLHTFFCTVSWILLFIHVKQQKFNYRLIHVHGIETGMSYFAPPPTLQKTWAYRFAHVCPSVGTPKLVRLLTRQCLDLQSSNFAGSFGITSRWPYWLKCQRSRSKWLWTQKAFQIGNWRMP